MESLGIPCEHIVTLLVYFGRKRLPQSFDLQQWTKSAKDVTEVRNGDSYGMLDAIILYRYLTMLYECKWLCKVASRKEEGYNKTIKKVRNEFEILEAESRCMSHN